MFGPFKASSIRLGGLLWKNPWRMSTNQKYRQRQRLKAVDNVIAIVEAGLREKNMECKSLDILKAELPKESEMLPKDKYTIFNRSSKHYRIGLHRMPKWTRISHRVNPKGF
ncbi:mitochondrial ribosomal protein L31-domain-containing protein [Dipodascopsis uninucleata]